jgi:hypothetical protein
VAKTFLQEHSCSLLSGTHLRAINDLRAKNGRPGGRATRRRLAATKKLVDLF